MTNEQLAVFLGAYVERLKAVIERMDDDLGEGVKREEERKYLGKDPPHSYARMMSTPTKNPEDWPEDWEVTETGCALVLQPLWEIVESMENDMETLLGQVTG